MGFNRSDTTMSAPQDASRAGFLSLPGELKNQIYRLALLELKPIVLKAVRSRGEGGRGKALRIGNGIPALLSTCQQIYRECSQIFYEENLFAFQDETLNKHAVDALYDKVHTIARKMRRIAVYRHYKIGDMKPNLIHFEIRLASTKRLVIIRPPNEKFPFPGIKSKIRGPFYEPCRCEVRRLVSKAQGRKSVNGEDIFEFLYLYVELVNRIATHAEIEVCETCKSVRRT